MDREPPRHEKIRFRRAEIADLGALPSACAVPPLGRSAIGRRARLLGRLAVAVGGFVLVLAVAVYALGASGIGAERLRAEAEVAIEKMAGVDVQVALGPARITLDGSSFLALQVRDVTLKTSAGEPLAEAGLVRFGVRLMPLLSGEIRLTSARIADARFHAATMPSTGGDWLAGLRNADGLVDPDKVVAATFQGVHQALDAVRLDSLREVRLQRVAFVLPEGAAVRQIGIADATVSQGGRGRMEVSFDADMDGRTITIDAAAVRDPRSRRVTMLNAEVDVDGSDAAVPANGGRLGTLALRLSGSEGGEDTASKLAISASSAGSVLDFGPRGPLSGDIDMAATLEAGSGKLSVDRLHVTSGRSTFDFEGSIGPKPLQASAGEEPSYRYDFVTNGSTLAPADSPEPAMQFIARIAGAYATASHALSADTIALKTGPEGGVVGNARVEFAGAQQPGVFLALNVHDMPVSHVKQLWPWFSAHSARKWVMENLFGGRVAEAELQYRVAPGRVGNGVPLTRDEVFGRFEVEGSRFDTAGRIPPVRDAVGVVEFHGNDVEISLKSGTVYMPSGRTVAASNGTLKVMKANVSPVVGALDIDVAGEAPAVAELASYEPINAMRHVGILPQELSGTVTGNVKADIPLQAGVDSDRLGWLVALDYRGLSLAKPVDGQIVTAADGSIVVDPDKAVIRAGAQLNGIPAEIDLVEPLERNGPPRSRKVALVIDDKTRETFMPGLSTLVSGTVKVALDKRQDGTQKVAADLTGARLTIPWAGWSKGPGVPADVTFTMSRSGSTTTLSDFELGGKSFAIDGSVVLSGGSLTSAAFGRVQLNRGDDVAVSVRRSAGNYAVKITGDSLDARPLIKQFMSDADTATRGTSGEAISVSATVKTLTGFNDERLSNLVLDYSAAGSRVNGLKVSAAAGSGAAISITDASGADGRALNMRSADAGAILRFLDIYPHMRGGAIALALTGGRSGALRGSVDARNFLIVDEPKLASIVSTPPAGDNRSLNQAVKADIDASRVQFERGYAEIEKGTGYLKLAKGVLRGPLIGTTFQGTLYDANDRMDMTGTFMPAYGINRIFGELPLVGALLGNGRDGGLIGVTYRLKGDVAKPDLHINPLSAIAPGIFRSIFEYR